jgi:maltodextrin utilization protein YvdJ
MSKAEESTHQVSVEELETALANAEAEKDKAVEKALKQAETEKDKAVEKALKQAETEKEAAVQAALEDYKKQLAKAENTPIKAENKKVRMVPIKIEKTKSERDDVFVCVNGKNFQIKRGEIVNVPEYVCEVLENMKKMDELAIERMEEATKNFA